MSNNRFKKEKHNIFSFFSVLIFSVTVIIPFSTTFLGITKISSTTDSAQLKSLEQAIRRSAVHCYATKGIYPPDLIYIKNHYAVSYDESKYFVDYKIFASNIMPDITVVKINKNRS